MVDAIEPIEVFDFLFEGLQVFVVVVRHKFAKSVPFLATRNLAFDQSLFRRPHCLLSLLVFNLLLRLNCARCYVRVKVPVQILVSRLARCHALDDYRGKVLKLGVLKNESLTLAFSQRVWLIAFF